MLLFETAIETNTEIGYEEPLKLFCVYLFITGGRLLYETLQANLKNILPSLSSIMPLVNEESKIIEGSLDMAGLKTFLVERNYPLKVFLSEDQTSLIKRVKYQSRTNQMMGFVTPLNKQTGFPEPENYEVESVKDIRTAFQEAPMSSTAYCFMAQPAVEKAPAYCLSVFGSDSKFSYQDVLNRWQTITAKAELHEIEILGFSADGDWRCLKAMRTIINFPSKPNIEEQGYQPPYLQYFWVSFKLNVENNHFHIVKCS